jgi:hypothetical protein
MILSTALYRRILLSIDSVDLLPSSQCICFAFCFDVFCPCQSSIEIHAKVFHVSFLRYKILKYFKRLCKSKLVEYRAV